MNLMVIGGGGREHAIVTFLAKNKEVGDIYVLPGNAGTAKIAKNIAIAATDIMGMVEFAKNNAIDFAFVAPDDPLVLGAVDALTEIGIPCFGPNKAAAIIEGSKAFSKDLMKRYSIPTASFEVFDDYLKALEYIEKKDTYPIVIKADGLSLGKGVTIAKDYVEAKTALGSVMKDRVFGASGDKVVIEEFLEGPEVSALCFCDGNVIKPMVSSMDHKAIYEGNKGPNTGGMGAVAPNSYYTEEIAKRCMNEIFIPTMNAMNKEGRTFKGCLYFGLMITKEGPKVIEYNCRFGDPETEVVLPLLETDLFTIVKAVAEGRLSEVEVKNKKGFACCVVLASGGYPTKYETGYEIDFSSLELDDNSYIFHAGTKELNGKIVTSGGRVLAVTAVDASGAREARKKAYDMVEKIQFKDMYYRKDIGNM